MLNALNISDNCYNCFNSYKRKKHQELFEVDHGNKIKEVTFASLYSKLGFKSKLSKALLHQQHLSHSQSKPDLPTNHHVILSKPFSLPKLKPKQTPNSLSYVYLHYYGDTRENIINDYHNVLRKEHVVINPHKVIESLKTLVMPHDIYGQKIFEFVSEMANGCYGSNCSRCKAVFQNQMESGIQTTETKEKVKNFLGSNDINIKSFMLEKVLHSVITHCMDIRTKNNEKISLQEIKTLYNDELERIRDCLTRNDKPKLIDKHTQIKKDNSIDYYPSYNNEPLTKDSSKSFNSYNNFMNINSASFNINNNDFSKEVNDSKNSLYSHSSNNITKFKCLPLVEDKVTMKDISQLKAQSALMNKQVNPKTTRDLIRKVFLNFKGEGSNNNITQDEFNNSQTSVLLNEVQRYENESQYITQIDVKLNPRTTRNNYSQNDIKIQAIPETEDFNLNEDDSSVINNEIKSRNKNKAETEVKSNSSNRMFSIGEMPNDKLEEILYNKKKIMKIDNTIPSSIESFSETEIMIQPLSSSNKSNKRTINKTVSKKVQNISKEVKIKQTNMNDSKDDYNNNNNGMKTNIYDDKDNSNELINYKEQSHRARNININKNITNRREREKNKDLMFEYVNIHDENRMLSKQSSSKGEDVNEKSDIVSNKIPQTTRSKSIEEISIRKDITNSPIIKKDDSLQMSIIEHKETKLNNINNSNSIISKSNSNHNIINSNNNNNEININTNVSISPKINQNIQNQQIKKQLPIIKNPELKRSLPETPTLNNTPPYHNETPIHIKTNSSPQIIPPTTTKEPKTSKKKSPIFKSQQQPSPPKKIQINKRIKDSYKKRDQSPFIKQHLKQIEQPSKQSITSSINSSYPIKQKSYLSQNQNSNNSLLTKNTTIQTPITSRRNPIQRSSIRGSIKPYKKLLLSQLKCANTLLLAFKTSDNFLIDKNFYNNQLYYKTLYKNHHQLATYLLSLNQDMKYKIYHKINYSPKLNCVKKSKEHFLQKYLMQDNEIISQTKNKKGTRFSISSSVHAHLLETLEIANSKMQMNHYNYYNKLGKKGEELQEGNNPFLKRKNKFARRYNYVRKNVKKSSLIDELNNMKKEQENERLEYDFQHHYKKLLLEKKNSLINMFEHKDKESQKYDMFLNQVEHLREENTDDYIKKIRGYFDEEYIKSELLKNKHQEDRLNKFAINFQWGIDRRREYKKFMERKLAFEYACVFKNKE